MLDQSQCSCRFLVGSTGEPFKNRLLFHRLESHLRAKHNRLVRGASVPRRSIDRSAHNTPKHHESDPKSIKSRLLSSRSRSTPMPRTDWSVQCRSVPNKPKQTINNGGRCVAIDVHGFANLHRHPNMVNPTCSCLAAISNMAVQSFCLLVGHGNPAPQPLTQAVLPSSPAMFWCYLRTAFPGSELVLWVSKDKEPVWN